MNNAYKLIYSVVLNAWVVVAEHVKGRGKQGSVRLHKVVALLGVGFLAGGQALAAPPTINQLPTGAQVTAGAVNISQTQTTTAASMAIKQASQQAIVNWQSFNVGANAQVNITQPDSGSVLLNRVLDTNPSQIFGQIKANGQVFLTNPNGVYFAPGSSVDVGSFTATTHGISDSDFLSGHYQFKRNGATGSILNQGSITAGLGGYIALLAPEVRNQGVVVAQVGGAVAMAAGESMQLQFNANKQLTNVLVTLATIQTLVDNGQAVHAPGGLIILSAQAANGLLGGVVKNSGAISATGLVSDGGSIRLSASHKIELAQRSSIRADAAPNSAGNGGRIEIIADLSQATSSTQVDGTLSAKGGDQGGDGGFVETSAANLNIAETTGVSTLAPKGNAGTWLLDPEDFTVAVVGGNITPTNLVAALNSSGVTITTTATTASCLQLPNVACGSGGAGNGDISIASPLSGWTANPLTLSAYRNVNLNAAITGSGSSTLIVHGGAGGVINLNADIATGGAQTYTGLVTNGNISTGAVVLGANAALSNTHSNVIFYSSINSASGNNFGLSVNNGSGNVHFGGLVGSALPLGYLTVTGGATATAQTTTFSADVKTNGAQTYGGNVKLDKNLSLSTWQNGNVSIAGNVDTSFQSSLLFQFLGGGNYSYSSNSGASFVNYVAAGNSSYAANVIAGFGSVSYDSSGSGTYTWTPSSTLQASYLAIGGGGSGGGRTGGGGGAGGVLTGNADFIATSPYSIVIGAGGVIPTAVAGSSQGFSGGSSALSGSGVSVIALGGGGGGFNDATGRRGLSGGSGGGSSDRPSGGINTIGGAGTAGQGNNGGTSSSWSGNYGAGGGGGAGGVGQNGSDASGGVGGGGIANPIEGSTVGQNMGGTYFIAGGGGGGSFGPLTAGGLGGGGSSTGNSATAKALANSGGGGGGSKSNGASSGAGGSGAVVINGSVSNQFSLSISAGSGKTSIGGSVSNVTALSIDSTHANSQVMGVISGATHVTKSGAGGVLNLSGNNTYTGGTSVSAGTLKAGSVSAFGTTAVSLVSSAVLDLNGYSIGNALSLGEGSAIGALTNSSVTAATASGNINLAVSSSIGGVGDVTLSGPITSNGYGLALLGSGAKTLSSTANTLSSIATGAAVGALNVTNNQALAIGQVTVGGNTYSGIDATGTVSVITRTGDLTISQNVVTTNTSVNTTTPALKLSAGDGTAAGTSTNGNVVLAGNPNLSAGGIAVVYSGDPGASTGVSAAIGSQANNFSLYNKSTADANLLTAAGYYALYRLSGVPIYLLATAGQSSIYGTAPVLNYWYSSSASSVVPVAFAGIPTTAQTYSLVSGAVSNTINVTNGVAGTLNLTGSPSISAGGLVSTTHAGTYALTLTPSLSLAGYIFSAGNAANYTVSPKPITVTSASRTTTYDGVSTYFNLTSTTPFSTSALVGADALASVTQTSAPSGVAQAGSFTVTPSAAVMGSGNTNNYTFSYAPGTHTVSPVALMVTAANASKSYDGMNYSGGNGVIYSGFVNNETAAVLGGSLTYTGTSQGALNAGSYVITPVGLTSNNYTVRFVDGSMVIAKAPLTATGSSASVRYNGGNQTVSGLTVSGLQGTDTLASLSRLTASGATAKNAGSYVNTVTAGVETNYTVSTVNGALEITKADAVVTARSDLGLTYNGVNQTVSGFTATGLVGTDTSTVLTGVTASRTEKNAGTYVTTASGTDGNYNLSFVDGSMVIAKAPLTATGNSASVRYNGSNQTVSGLTVSGLQGTDNLASLSNLTSSGATAKNAGSYVNTVTAGVETNYDVATVNGALEIAKADAVVTARSDLGLTYNGVNQTVSGFTATGLVGGETATVLTGVTASRTEKNAGTYVTTASGTDGNYNLSFVDGSMMIAKAPLSITAVNGSKQYDGTAHSGGFGIRASGFVNNETQAVLGGTLSYAGTSQGAINAGNYVVTPAGLTSGNYELNYTSGNLTINPAVIVVVPPPAPPPTPDPEPEPSYTFINGALVGSVSKVYDGTNKATLLPSNFSLFGFASGEGATVTKTQGTYDTPSAGTAKIVSVSLTEADYRPVGYTNFSNYILPTSLSARVGVISKAPLVVNAVNAAKIYDGQSYAGGNGVNISGFVNGEAVASLVGSIAYTGSSQGARDAGTYAITPTGLSGSNYEIKFNTARLEIAKLSLVAKADQLSKPFMSADPALTYTVSGLPASAVLSGSLVRVPGESLGTYVVKQGSLAANSNYDLKFESGNLQITPGVLSSASSVFPFQAKAHVEGVRILERVPLMDVSCANLADARWPCHALNTDKGVK
jgi:filamentous hemagglutinin family protein